MLTVPQLLDLSQKAHLRAQVRRRARDLSGHLECISEALERRLEAHALDPEHRDPAWQAEAAPSRKVRFLDADLLTFYRKELAIPDRAELAPVRRALDV